MDPRKCRLTPNLSRGAPPPESVWSQSTTSPKAGRPPKQEQQGSSQGRIHTLLPQPAASASPLKAAPGACESVDAGIRMRLMQRGSDRLLKASRTGYAGTGSSQNKVVVNRSCGQLDCSGQKTEKLTHTQHNRSFFSSSPLSPEKLAPPSHQHGLAPTY
jgi:hypothetical protein